MKNLEPWQYRLLVERNELRDRCEKLLNFIISDKFHEVELDQQELLKAQADYMGDYLNILNQRIIKIEA